MAKSSLSEQFPEGASHEQDCIKYLHQKGVDKKAFNLHYCLMTTSLSINQKQLLHTATVHDHQILCECTTKRCLYQVILVLQDTAIRCNDLVKMEDYRR